MQCNSCACHERRACMMYLQVSTADHAVHRWHGHRRLLLVAVRFLLVRFRAIFPSPVSRVGTHACMIQERPPRVRPVAISRSLHSISIPSTTGHYIRGRRTGREKIKSQRERDREREPEMIYRQGRRWGRPAGGAHWAVVTGGWRHHARARARKQQRRAELRQGGGFNWARSGHC